MCMEITRQARFEPNGSVLISVSKPIVEALGIKKGSIITADIRKVK